MSNSSLRSNVVRTKFVSTFGCFEGGAEGVGDGDLSAIYLQELLRVRSEKPQYKTEAAVAGLLAMKELVESWLLHYQLEWRSL